MTYEEAKKKAKELQWDISQQYDDEGDGRWSISPTNDRGGYVRLIWAGPEDYSDMRRYFGQVLHHGKDRDELAKEFDGKPFDVWLILENRRGEVEIPYHIHRASMYRNF